MSVYWSGFTSCTDKRFEFLAFSYTCEDLGGEGGGGRNKKAADARKPVLPPSPVISITVSALGLIAVKWHFSTDPSWHEGERGVCVCCTFINRSIMAGGVGRRGCCKVYH